MTMSNAKIACLVISMLCLGAAAHRLLETGKRDLADAEEHQRILAELEAVHQLRERMLQQGRVIADCPLHPCDTACSGLLLCILSAANCKSYLFSEGCSLTSFWMPINAVLFTVSVSSPGHASGLQPYRKQHARELWSCCGCTCCKNLILHQQMLLQLLTMHLQLLGSSSFALGQSRA